MAIAFSATAGAAPTGEKAITCTNPASGANWQIRIDYDHKTVDSQPALISEAEISWHTAGGENYKLDRKSGNLTVIVASSTGGYFLHDTCKLDD
ncbi:MAG TPA: hypothetical protein VL048_18310 [Xanthobacteraceae bacterium]|nr:hypothetical protein [Xanthobacteraceae bacterium]